MRKYILPLFFIVLALTTLSWGVTGHKTIALIAENHLTAKAKNGVQMLLGNQSMSDVASWADEVRNNPEYKNTASWHFLNLPLGLNYDQFVVAVSGQNKENIYSALNKCREELIDKTSTAEQKAIALKFIIHLVGDIHQPMHISRAEDKGGNTIQVTYDGKGTNLHSLWDSKLLEHQGLGYVDLAKAYDKATPAQIKQWQGDDILKWLYESYQISSELYAEVEKNNKIDSDYYKTHLPIIEQRIEKGGIRLAGILNNAFEHVEVTKAILTQPAPVGTSDKDDIAVKLMNVEDASKNIGVYVTTYSKVYETKEVAGMVLVSLGGNYPKQLLTVVFKGEAKALAKDLTGKSIEVEGTVVNYKGKPEIIISDPTKIKQY